MAAVTGLFPWSDVAWDLARAQGVDPDAVVNRLGQSGVGDVELATLHEALNIQLATDLWQDLLCGRVTARNADGKPLPPPQPTDHSGPNRPLVWVDDINEWLAAKGRIDRWQPQINDLRVAKQSVLWLQEREILFELSRQGHDAKAVPQNRGGPGGLKSKIRHALAKHPLFRGSTTFEKAWERLRADKAIIDAE